MAGPLRFVIAGGGITGLSAARAAVLRAREIGRLVHVTVLEASDRVGGHLVTEHRDGFVLDGGPDSWVAAKPQASALARALDLAPSLIGTRGPHRGYYVAMGTRLQRVPEGLVLGVPTRLAPLVSSRLFSLGGKMRIALEPFIPRRVFARDEDESIDAFAARRLGREAADRLVAPLLGGISAGDATTLSIRAAFPQLLALEQDHGSLVKGMRATVRTRRASDEARVAGSANPGPTSAFVSLKGGVASLTDALAAWLRAEGVDLRTGVPIRRVECVGPSFRVDIDGPALTTDALLLAVPAYVAAPLLRGIDSPSADLLESISFGSTGTVFLAYRQIDVLHPLDGVGFVVPRSAGRPLLASTWVSSKWSGRAPAGAVLLRVFFGGPAGEEVLGESNDGLAGAARAELRTLMGIDATPLWCRVFRFPRGTAQMRVGHLVRMQRLRERIGAISPSLRIAGGGYDGIGIPDCVRQGEEAGRALVQQNPGA